MGFMLGAPCSPCCRPLPCCLLQQFAPVSAGTNAREFGWFPKQQIELFPEGDGSVGFFINCNSDGSKRGPFLDVDLPLVVEFVRPPSLCGGSPLTEGGNGAIVCEFFLDQPSAITIAIHATNTPNRFIETAASMTVAINPESNFDVFTDQNLVLNTVSSTFWNTYVFTTPEDLEATICEQQTLNQSVSKTFNLATGPGSYKFVLEARSYSDNQISPSGTIGYSISRNVLP